MTVREPLGPPCAGFGSSSCHYFLHETGIQIHMPYRTLTVRQRAQIWVGGPEIGQPELLFESDTMLIEAPNWSLDVGSRERGLARVDFEGLPELNNDHVLDPDGEHIYMSAIDGHIYRGDLDGGPVDRVSPEDGYWHFLHGVSPDGSRLAYVQIGEIADPGKLALLDPPGPPVGVDTGEGHLDGPEWSPDGKWIYFNTESFP